MLKKSVTREAGCDEAGRGCLAGPVFAAAVILPDNFYNPLLNDSKQLTEKKREELRTIIERESVSWAVSMVDNREIDKLNILRASITAMHRAIKNLKTEPSIILVDGNRFFPYKKIPHKCIVKGDSIYSSIAAASILAKTHRDEFMINAHKEFPQYNWESNKGYPTKKHRELISVNGVSPLHRRSFRLTNNQLTLNFKE
ncbi:ribonuclease HII [Marinilabiliaceae bacterium ANBcel2]|nr:ribonuclease HII [Marinilabiliaceae bacterium ANBcel2]